MLWTVAFKLITEALPIDMGYKNGFVKVNFKGISLISTCFPLVFTDLGRLEIAKNRSIKQNSKF